MTDDFAWASLGQRPWMWTEIERFLAERHIHKCLAHSRRGSAGPCTAADVVAARTMLLENYGS